MVKVWLPSPGGSYFCEQCFLEYEKEGICSCGGEIKFISMHSNEYLSAWMSSKRALVAMKERDNKKKINSEIVI